MIRVFAFLFLIFFPHLKGHALAQVDATSFSVVEATVAETHQAIRSGELTCQQLVRAYLERIDQLDQPTTLNSIVVVNKNAIARAAELDKQFAETGILLPLHGIPVVVKDNYDVIGLPTTAGSICLRGSIPPDNAHQIQRLHQAGAIVLCKSNMAEFAYSPFFTVSSIAGITRNPYDLDRVPAGSSGGTAAAIAANLGMIGLGTDTGNSIRGPSSHCCLVGIRPTLGLTSRDGIVPLFLRNDIGGPMCRTVKDTARLLQVLAGFDRNDEITKLSNNRIPESYVDLLKPDSLQGVRLGVFRTLSDADTADEEVSKLFEQALQDLVANGAELVDPFDIRGLDSVSLGNAQQVLWKDTFANDIALYLSSLGDEAPVHNIQEIIHSGKFHDSIKERLAISARPSNANHSSSAFPEHDPNRKRLLDQVIAAMDEARIEAFIFPTWNNPPRKVGDLRSPNGNNSYHIPPHTGQPAITVPMGFTESGLPAGLQMVGRPFSESSLLSLAYAYEQATKHRKPPERFGHQTP